MSRCFPYPPPGYSRNGATYEALIESIKLQKENEKAKAERKKERRARKEKRKDEEEKRKDNENDKSKKNPNGFLSHTQKGSQSSVDFKVHDKRREPSTEQLERSDLTEEHGQPVGTHKPSYSSDSTQNSNKRKRDDAARFPDGTNVKPIKIRLLKKHQGPDSSKETLYSDSGRTDPPHICDADPRANNWGTSTSGRTDLPAPSVSNSVGQVPGLHPKDRTTLVPNSGRMGLSAPSKTGTRAVQKSTPSFVRPGKTAVPAPSGMKDNDAQGVWLSGKQSILSSGRPILPPGHLKNGISGSNLKNEKQLIPSSGRPVLPPSHLKNGISGSNLKKAELSAPPGPNVTAGKRSSGEIPVPAKINDEVVRPTRFEKKLQKQHKKYEKLVGSWVPPVLQTQLCGGDDEDWLSRKKDVTGGKEDKTCRSSTDDVETTCRESAAGSLWRPAACLLPEADIYALPFTVPF